VSCRLHGPFTLARNCSVTSGTSAIWRSSSFRMSSCRKSRYLWSWIGALKPENLFLHFLQRTPGIPVAASCSSSHEYFEPQGLQSLRCHSRLQSCSCPQRNVGIFCQQGSCRACRG